MEYFYILIGIIALYYGGECLVRGSVALSLRFGLSAMIVGLTVMAFGTSAPELLVSLRSALAGFGDIAFGNAIGSNIANVLLILGVPAMIAPLATDQVNSRSAWMEMMAASLLFSVLLLFSPFGFFQGLVLILAFIIVLGMQFRRAASGKMAVDLEMDANIQCEPTMKIITLILLGIILLPVGANFLVNGAVEIARRFDIPEAVIGSTIVAIGTSLPELAASISAARKGETAMALGNVLGSNLFNLLLVIGVTGLVSTTFVAPSLIRFDVPVMLLVSAGLAYVVFWPNKITRGMGVVMVMAYLVYLAKLSIWS